MTRKKENYAPPQVKVVKFKVDRGFDLSGEKNSNNLIPDFKTTESSSRNNAYEYDNDWSSSFTAQ